METCSIPAKEAECENTNGPNWLELPTDITANILQRLTTIEIVTRVCQVCPLWWNIFKDPLMWRSIRITDFRNARYCHEELEKICRFAVKRSCGQLEDIDIEFLGTDDLLECIAENSNIRCIRLATCQRISNIVFCEAVRKFPLLEEVDISMCNLCENSLEVLGRSCPFLKSFKYARMYAYIGCSDGVAFVIAKTMKGLCHLDIEGNMLTNDGLLAILDSCPRLESLDIEGCFNLNLTGSLGRRCQEQIKSLRLPIWFKDEDYDSDYDSEYSDLDDDYYTDEDRYSYRSYIPDIY